MTVTTSGCCLYLGPEGIEAVGQGTVSAYADKPQEDRCGIEVLINGQITNTVDVQDGDRIEISLYSNDECSCCEVQRECNAKNAAALIMKSSKDKGTITLDKKKIDERIKSMALNMAKRRMGLR